MTFYLGFMERDGKEQKIELDKVIASSFNDTREFFIRKLREGIEISGNEVDKALIKRYRERFEFECEGFKIKSKEDLDRYHGSRENSRENIREDEKIVFQTTYSNPCHSAEEGRGGESPCGPWTRKVLAAAAVAAALAAMAVSSR